MIFPHLFSFIRFTSSSDFFLFLLLNYSLIIRPKLDLQTLNHFIVGTIWTYTQVLGVQTFWFHFSEICVSIASCPRDIYTPMSLIISYLSFVIINCQCCPCTNLFPLKLIYILSTPVPTFDLLGSYIDWWRSTHSSGWSRSSIWILSLPK